VAPFVLGLIALATDWAIDRAVLLASCALILG